MHKILVSLIFVCTSYVIGCAHELPVETAKDHTGEFLLGPEDVVEITVWRNQDLSRVQVIRPDGLISMPIIGDVRAAGLTANALAKNIGDRLAEFVAKPVVTASVKDINSYAIFVLGEVIKPGRYTLKSYTTLLQAISMAGGFTEFAKRNRLQVLRIHPNGDGRLHEERIPVRFDDVVAGRGEPGNMVLKSGDTVVVP